MGKFKELEDFEARFPDKMDVAELQRWKQYWTQHAQHLQPKVKKQAMKRVYSIERVIAAKESEPPCTGSGSSASLSERRR